MKTKQIMLTFAAVLPAVLSPLEIPAATNAYDQLVILARATTDAYPKLRDEFLRTNTIRFDAVEATRAGWEAGLMAWIMNARQESPQQSHQWDAAPAFMNRSGTHNYVLNPTSRHGQAMMAERLWKGGWLAGTDVRRAGSKPFDLLPRYARIQICYDALFWVDIQSPEELWRAVAQGDGPAELKAVALYRLAHDEGIEAKEIASELLRVEIPKQPPKRDEVPFDEAHRFSNAALPSAYGLQFQKEGLYRGLRDRRTNWGWEVLRDSFPVWESETNVMQYSYSAVSAQPNPEAKAFLRSMALDVNAAHRHRKAALLCLADRSGGANFDVFSTVLRDPKTPPAVAAAATERLYYYPPAQVRVLAEEVGVEKFDLATQQGIIRALRHKGGTEELRYIRQLSERTDIPPALRQEAQRTANEMSKWVR